MKTGAGLLIECLESEGVEYIFGIPGEQTIPVMEQIRKSDITFVTVRHEQGAAFMADIYSRLSDKTGVCLSTLGPGATNLATGIGNATLDNSSVVAITSQRELSDHHKDTHQFIDTTQLFESITKQTQRVKEVKMIPEQVRKAFEVANTGISGAAHIEFPSNVSSDTADKSPINSTDDQDLADGVRSYHIKQTIDTIAQSDSPVVLSGHGSLSASNEISRLVSNLAVPVTTTFMGKGCISSRSEYFAGTIGYSRDDPGMNAIRDSDLVITIGYDYIEYHPENWAADKDIIHINQSKPEIDENYNTILNLLGNVSTILRQMNSHLSERKTEKNRRTKDVRGKYIKSVENGYRENSTPPFTPQQVVHAVRKALSDRDILISDVGSHKYWFSRRYPTYKSNTFIVSNGFASMGIALPGCISASLVTDRNVVAVSGDGGFMMNMQEIETAKRLGLSPTVIILDDEEYTAISMEQSNEYQELSGSTFDNPDFVKLAESFGINGHKVTQASKITNVIQNSLHSDSMSLVSIPIDPKESYRLESQSE